MKPSVNSEREREREKERNKERRRKLLRNTKEKREKAKG